MKIKPHASKPIVTRMDGQLDASIPAASATDIPAPQMEPTVPPAQAATGEAVVLTTPFSPLVDNAASRAKATSAKSWGNRYLKGSYGNGVPHKAR